MLIYFLRWWYGPGWAEALKRVLESMRRVWQTFSAPLLIHTLWAPWKRIVSSPGRSLDEKMKAAVDNFISRLVGFAVRLLVLATASLLSLLAGLANLAVAVFWPLLPLGLFIFAYLGLKG